MPGGYDNRHEGSGRREVRHEGLAGSAGSGITVEPSPAVMAMLTIDPTVSISGPIVVSPAPAVFALTAVAPSVGISGGAAAQDDEVKSLLWRV